MRKIKLLMWVGLLLAVGSLCACQAADSPEAQRDGLLPPDWQQTEDWRTLTNRPELRLVYQGQCYEPLLCNHSWAYADKAGQIVSYVACGAHPVEVQPDMPRLSQPTEAESTVQLVWQAQPTEYQVTAYDYTWWEQHRELGYTIDNLPKCQIAPPENELSLLMDQTAEVYALTADNGCVTYEQPPGSYVYVVQAEWRSDAAGEQGLGGSAEWAFFVE